MNANGYSSLLCCSSIHGSMYVTSSEIIAYTVVMVSCTAMSGGWGLILCAGMVTAILGYATKQLGNSVEEARKQCKCAR